MTAAERVRAAYAAIANAGRPEIWITLRPPGDVLAEAARIDARPAAAALPLAGLVAAVKDNIDVAGLPTTAAAPCYAYEPDRDATAVARLRAVGAIVIGKTFMAPEQVAGGAAVTPSIDVFALGGLAAFAALGRPPFGADTAAAVLYRVLHEPPDLTGCPEPVHGLVLRCLALEPADRPALDEIITGPAGRPAAARDPGAGPRGGRGDRARAGRGRRRGRAGAAPPGPGRRGGSRAGRHARASPQVPSASPSPSLAPGVDPCVVGTWTGTVGDIQIIIDGQPVPATGTGPTEIDLPDGTQEEVYGSRTVFTATSGGNTWTDVFTGSATPHYEDIGGLVYLSDISAHGSWQLLENGALNNSGPLTIAPQPYRYTCSGNEMREFYPAPATGSQESARKLPPPGQGS